MHQKTVVACVLLTEPTGRVQRAVRTFGTMTADLLALNGWLNALAVEQVALESTGIYWRPVFNLLEADHESMLVNAQHLKAVPGRKTAVKACSVVGGSAPAWPREGELHSPAAAARTARAHPLSQDAGAGPRPWRVNRLHKVLEGANLKLGAVATDVLGTSGRDMLAAILAGEQDPLALAELARGRLLAKLPALRQALEGRVTAQHRLLIRQVLTHIDFLEQQLAELTAEIETQLAPFAEAVALLETIPGVAEAAASAIVAELGIDMTRFPSAKHLASWAGLCPGNKQSGGKRLSGKTTQGNVWLRAVLGEVAWSITHTSGNYLVALYHRVARRRGKQKAIVALAHSLLVSIYSMLRDHQPYRDLGSDHFDRLESIHVQHHYVHRLEQLGYAVTLTLAAAP